MAPINSQMVPNDSQMVNNDSKMVNNVSHTDILKRTDWMTVTDSIVPNRKKNEKLIRTD